MPNIYRDFLQCPHPLHHSDNPPAHVREPWQSVVPRISCVLHISVSLSVIDTLVTIHYVSYLHIFWIPHTSTPDLLIYYREIFKILLELNIKSTYSQNDANIRYQKVFGPLYETWILINKMVNVFLSSKGFSANGIAAGGGVESIHNKNWNKSRFTDYLLQQYPSSSPIFLASSWHWFIISHANTKLVTR